MPRRSRRSPLTPERTSSGRVVPRLPSGEELTSDGRSVPSLAGPIHCSNDRYRAVDVSVSCNTSVDIAHPPPRRPRGHPRLVCEAHPDPAITVKVHRASTTGPKQHRTAPGLSGRSGALRLCPTAGDLDVAGAQPFDVPTDSDPLTSPLWGRHLPPLRLSSLRASSSAPRGDRGRGSSTWQLMLTTPSRRTIRSRNSCSQSRPRCRRPPVEAFGSACWTDASSIRRPAAG
jgi:hypothetical protein